MSHLYHFSDQGDIEVFRPRPPLAHPRTEAFVFAIDEWHSPLYLFPRDCPRTGIWPVEKTSAEDRRRFLNDSVGHRMILAIQVEFEEVWSAGTLFRYTFESSADWLDTNDHGCWVSRKVQRPLHVVQVSNLPEQIAKANCHLVIVNDLSIFTQDYRNTSLHVSAIRHRLLVGSPSKESHPVRPS